MVENCTFISRVWRLSHPGTVTGVTPLKKCDGRHSHFEMDFSKRTNLLFLLAIAPFNPKFTLVFKMYWNFLFRWKNGWIIPLYIFSSKVDFLIFSVIFLILPGVFILLHYIKQNCKPSSTNYILRNFDISIWGWEISFWKCIKCDWTPGIYVGFTTLSLPR